MYEDETVYHLSLIYAYFSQIKLLMVENKNPSNGVINWGEHATFFKDTYKKIFCILLFYIFLLNRLYKMFVIWDCGKDGLKTPID